MDPDYAPFGWRWLRGLNALPFVLYLPIAVSRGLIDFKSRVSFRGTTPLLAATLEALDHVPAQLLIGLVAMTPMMIAAVVALNVTESRPNPWRIAGLLTAQLFAAALITPLVLQLAIVLGELSASASLFSTRTASKFVERLMLGTLATAPIYLRSRRQKAVRALRDTKLERVNASRQETEGRLQSLQAQIEPHFLFNTLAHILRLHQVDATRGRAMLQSLTDYMRSALPQMRGSGFTLGQELALTSAYVNVQQIRMGERLRIEIDVPAALMPARLPPMTVLTLAENAVKHGIGPKSEGGTLRIEASLRDDQLEVAVCDDGVGLRIGAGTGHGLSNTRSRLSSIYGRRGRLSIGNREGGGVRAVLRVPFTPVSAEATS